MFKKIALIFFVSLLAACSEDNNPERKLKNTKVQSSAQVTGRWYTSAQVAKGEHIYRENCAVCHGDKGQGLVEDWRKPLADGSYPPPPLNGTAHTWHHSMEVLVRTINRGGVPLGGKMPAFKDKLSDEEKQAVLAHIMSLWPDEIYAEWKKRFP